RAFSVAAQEKSIRMKVNPAAASGFISSPCGSVKWMFTPSPKGSVVGDVGSAIDIGGLAMGLGLTTRVVARVVVVVRVVVRVVVVVVCASAAELMQSTIRKDRRDMRADCNRAPTRAGGYFPAFAPSRS